jgi:hypothetical protein
LKNSQIGWLILKNIRKQQEKLQILKTVCIDAENEIPLHPYSKTIQHLERAKRPYSNVII